MQESTIKNTIRVALIFLISLNVIIWQEVSRMRAVPELNISFLDIGQGDSILITTRDSAQILIDGGPDRTVLTRIAQKLPFYDRSLDLVIITHPHRDHIGGLIDILDRYAISAIIESGARYDTNEYIELDRRIREMKIRRILATKPLRIYFGDGAELNTLTPNFSFYDTFLKNPHDANIVSELTFENKKILFMGDAESKLENLLLARASIDDVDVLKVGHHGSKTSSAQVFLDVAQPEFAVISVGKNSYGHPHPEVLERLFRAGAMILRTDRDGAIDMHITQGKISVQKEK